MIFCFIINMLCILILCPVLLVAVQTLTIDSQLGTSIEDCFERISIGEQLPLNAIYRNVSELTTRECEQICKQDKQCQTYDYGVGAKGNATCNLSSMSEKELKEQSLLQRHPDYDVYVRRIQCEQSPPTPIQGQFDDPGDGTGGPAHRPVFRPDEDDFKRPLADEYPSDDLRPYETARPPYLNQRPSYHGDNDRPDDYSNSKPDNDSPPSYGAHKPQDIPFKPEKPYQNQPQQKPHPIHTRPDDILHFQDPYRPSHDHGNWRPDPHYPSRPEDDIPDLYGQRPIRPNRPYDFPEGIHPYHPEKPDYHYIIRPNRKPRPPEDIGYGLKPTSPHDYPTKPDPYGQSDIGHPSRPIGPPDRPLRPSRPQYDYPFRPHDRPSYSYNSQYASNYGQNDYDNSIYLEIYDPPRPYKPYKPHDKPDYGQRPDGYGQDFGYGVQGYGYGSSHLSQSSYSQSQSSHSHYYGTGTITEIENDHNYNRPQDSGYRPQKPHHDKPGYSSESDYGTSGGYGIPSKPNDSQKPYGNNQHQDNQGIYSSSSQSSYSSNQAYGSTSESYGSNQQSYGSQNDYGSKPGYGSTTTQRPIYGYYKPNYSDKPIYDKPDKPIYDKPNKPYDDKPYGGNQGIYTSGSQSHLSQEQYNSQHSYSSSQESYGHKPSYIDDRPYDNRPLYGDKPFNYNKPSSYGNDKPSHGEHVPTYDVSSPSYGNKPYNDNKRPPYNDYRPFGDNKPINDYNRPSYGENKPPYNDNKPSYGDTDNRPSYGGNKPYNDNKRPTYNDNDNRPSYGDNKPSYNDHKRPSYGDSSNRPVYDSNKPYNDNKPPVYGANDRPSYSENKPPHHDNGPPYENKPSYGIIKPYDDNKRPIYGGGRPPNDNKRPYGDDRPDPSYDTGSDPFDTGFGYGDNKKAGHKPGISNGTGYNRPDVKPVYEHELDRPSNVPSYIVRPGGDVVTSRPVTIGDYGERGYPGRGPVSYKVESLPADL